MKPLLRPAGLTMADISPNGRWVAYQASGPGQDEVYVESLLRGGTIGNMQTMINLAFHEAMHNKLQAGKELHNDGGLAADRNWPEDTLNDTNIRKMRAALATSVIQDTQYLSLQSV